MTKIRLDGLMETVTLAITRLDARLSASPLQEFWQVRAAMGAAERLAATDGTATLPWQLSAYISGSPLPSPEDYRGAAVAFGHWARIISSLSFTRRSEQLLGLSEDRKIFSPAEYTTISEGRDESWEDLARISAARTMRAMAGDPSPPLLRALIEQLGSAMGGINADASYYERVHEARMRVERNISECAPSITGRNLAAEIIDLLDWEPRRLHGASFSVVPDWLRLHGFTTCRLSCLTGATKRMTFEGRKDDRAIRGFLSVLLHEATAGMDLLRRLERAVVQLPVKDANLDDARSVAPDILHALFLLPACDTGWLEDCLGLDGRVTRKLIQRFADLGIIEDSGERRSQRTEDDKMRSTRLWALKGFAEVASPAPAPALFTYRGPSPSPREIITRGSLDRFDPMQVVYDRFDKQLIEIEEQFGAIWSQRGAKTAPRQSPSQGQN